MVQKQVLQLDARARQEIIARLLTTLVEGETQVLNHLAEVDVVGHRVVHGGSDYWLKGNYWNIG